MDKLDKLFTTGLDKLQQVVEEYPQKQTATSLSQQGSNEGLGAVIKQWQQFSLAPRKAQLIETLNSLQSGQDNFDVSPLLEIAEDLTQLTDPALYLERAQAVEEQLKELRERNSKLEKQLQSNQLDNEEINKLIDQSKKLELERAEFSTKIESKDTKIAELQQQLKENMEHGMAMQDLEQELVRTKKQFRELQIEYEEAQGKLFEITSKKESDLIGQSSEIEGLLQEMEALQISLSQLRHENEQLTLRLNDPTPQQNPTELVIPLQTEIDDLRLQLKAKTVKIQEFEQQLSNIDNNNELQAQIDEQSFIISELQRKIEGLPTQEQHESALNRVRELQALVDVQIEKEGWEGKQGEREDQSGELEVVETLRERNRALSDESVSLRRDLANEVANAKAAVQESDKLREAIERKEALVSVLEEQLAEASKSDRGDDEMLGIISQQRDRYRDRVQHLEIQAEESRSKLRETDLKLQSFQKDNVELLEKVRYLEQYRQSKQGLGGGLNNNYINNPKIIRVDNLGVASEGGEVASRYDCGPFQIGMKGSGGLRSRGGGNRASCWGGESQEQQDEELGEVESRYSKAYEEKLNPFTKFQSNEVQKRMQKMQLPDRAVLSGSQMLLASRTARIFVVAYTVLLHVFIFSLLYIAVSPKVENGQVDDSNVAQVEQSVAAYLSHNATNSSNSLLKL
eukprot:TRINITY_DN1895_c0_g1_i18.p1 TRINITY_DN1895_c0_g1~~TRINITY_DN1895_c0_g1_i18.p1  ORF type:complete len:722 (-),score=137.08 TRINITY_DN1895_c0_g1_i18:934-2988(-)